MTIFELLCTISAYPDGSEVYIGSLPNDEQCLKVYHPVIFPDGEVICELPTGA